MPGVPSITQFDPLQPPWSTLALDQNFIAQTALLASANNYNTYLADSGAANVYVVAFSAGITVSYTAGLVVQFKAANANTGASTLNVNSLGAKTITRQNGAALQAGDIPLNGLVQCQYDGTNFQLQTISNPSQTQPTRTVLTGGSGTYTTPANAKRLVVRLVGGGGASETRDSGGTTFAGGNGGASTFSTFSAGGGIGGAATPANSAGGTASGGTVNVPGGIGLSGITISASVFIGGFGGSSIFGTNIPQYGNNTVNGIAGPTYGVGASGGISTTALGLNGGGGGAYCEGSIANPVATYAYVVGPGGTPNAGIGGGSQGQAGGTGIIIIDEYYF